MELVSSKPGTRIALVGDFNPDVLAHRAINECFNVALHHFAEAPQPCWIGTQTIVYADPGAFREVHGIWCVPASPYRNMEGALWAIEYARNQLVPFLGTCGGYQHALVEFARNCLKLPEADHAESNPDTVLPLIQPMPCSLIEKAQPVIIDNNDFRGLYGGASGLEGYHCSYGLNPEYEKLFHVTPLEIVARSEEGSPRAIRLKNHPFFIGTQFQPERRALTGALHPLIASFFSAATKYSNRDQAPES